MKSLIKVIFIFTSVIVLAACGTEPRDESPTLDNLMKSNEERNSILKEGRIEHRFTNDASVMEDYMIRDYEILEEEYGDEFFVYLSILGGVEPGTDLKNSYSAYLVAKPDSETAKLFKQHLDGEVNASDWAILKQNLTESAYDNLYVDVEKEDRIDILFYDPFLYDPPVLITFPGIHNKVLEFY